MTGGEHMLLQPIGPLRTRRLAVGITTAVMLAAIVLAAFVATGGRTALGARGGGGPRPSPPRPRRTTQSTNPVAHLRPSGGHGPRINPPSAPCLSRPPKPPHPS